MLHKRVYANESVLIKMENPAHGVLIAHQFQVKNYMYTMSVMCFTSNFFFI